MIIRTNLCWELVEHHRPRNQNRPIILLAVLALLGGAYYWWMLEQEAEPLRRAYATQQAKLLAENQKLEAARLVSAELAVKAKKREVIVNYAKSRLNWAPVLEQMFSAIPAGIELSSIQASSSGNEYYMTVTGSAAARQPRIECDKFRILLGNTFSSFASEMDSKFIKLANSDRKIQLVGEDQPVADFIIKLTWKKKSDG